MAEQQLITFTGKVLEMFTENPAVNVPVDPRIDIDTITAEDPSPKFVNVEVLRKGTSGNNRRYNNKVVEQTTSMIPGTQGFLGHPDPSKAGFEFREPQCIYVGAATLPDETGDLRTVAKAYLFKDSPLRTWIPASIAAGNPMTVSINGNADVLRNGDCFDVLKMNDLQSIDWANPGTEGMPTSQAMSVVSEMNNKTGGNNMSETSTQDIIKGVTLTELKAYNPVAYNAVIANATLTELQGQNPDLVKQIKDSAKITEMKLAVDGQEKSVKLTEMQDIITGYETKINDLSNQIKTAKLTEFKNNKITELVPEKLRKQIGERVAGNTEDEITKSIDTEIAYVREMMGSAFDNLPIGGTTPTGDARKQAVAALFGTHQPEKK